MAAPPPSRRRKRAECESRIIEAARIMFADRGYDDTTTREIARQAEVSETLLFRYFGSKASLFDHILFAPVGGLMNSFLTGRSASSIDADPVANARAFLTSLFKFADDHRTLLISFASRQMLQAAEEEVRPTPPGIATFYDLAIAEIRRVHARQGTRPAVEPEIAVRLNLGMAISSILFADWLFSGRPLERETLIESLACMLVHANLGPGSRSLEECPDQG